MYLVDTNVLSAGAPTKTVPDPALAAWMEQHSGALFLSVITVAEVQGGIAKAVRNGAFRKAERLGGWLDTVLHLYAARVLPLDVQVALALGRLSDIARAHGQNPGLADLAIAATAQHHGCIVLTRNLRHFLALGVAAHDPFASLPAGP
jgi:predicted nucleic acid-binding protein